MLIRQTLVLGLAHGHSIAAISDPDRVARVSADYPGREVWDTTFTKQHFDQVKGAARSLSALGALLWSSPENVILSGRGEPEALKGACVSANFLEILGVARRAVQIDLMTALRVG